jgi:hypothetical protein
VITALAQRGFHVPNALTLAEKRVMECVRDGRLPWDCLPKVVDIIACIDHLIDRGLIEDCGGTYRLTAPGLAALDKSS